MCSLQYEELQLNTYYAVTMAYHTRKLETVQDDYISGANRLQNSGADWIARRFLNQYYESTVNQIIEFRKEQRYLF
jgi:hypothetical protein